MSAWKLRLKALYDLPAGRHPANRFDPCDLKETTSLSGLAWAMRKGYIELHRAPDARRNDSTYSITALGRDVVEGRARVLTVGAGAGQRGRRKNSSAATWLSSLPRGNEIRI